MKMAVVDISPFGKHDKTDEQPDTGETILFTPGGIKRPFWEPECEPRNIVWRNESENRSSQRTHQCFVLYALQRNR